MEISCLNFIDSFHFRTVIFRRLPWVLNPLVGVEAEVHVETGMVGGRVIQGLAQDHVTWGYEGTVGDTVAVKVVRGVQVGMPVIVRHLQLEIELTLKIQST